MKFNNCISIFILFFSLKNGEAQIIYNSNEVYSINKIHDLIVCPDSNLMSCPIAILTFDSLGRTVSVQEGTSEDIELFWYDSIGNKLGEILGFRRDDGSIDTNIVHYYEYDYSNSQHTKLIKAIEHDYDADTTKSIYVEQIKGGKLVGPKFSDYGVSEHIENDINFPCHSSFIGKHKLKYSYRKNGLIDKIEVIPLTKKGRSQTWYFLYNNT